MTFADIPTGAPLFIDANTFIYHFTAPSKFSAACTALLERVERKEIDGWTSPHILAEISHRLMTIEACTAFGWPYQGIAARLRTRPQEVRKLNAYQRSLEQIKLLGLHMAAHTEQCVTDAAAISKQFGLLTNDALVVAAMQASGIANLASNDADFDRVLTITRYAPA